MKWGLLALGLPALAQAGWTFEAAQDVAAGKGVFHHLEASGRQALAVSGGRVAIVWEDDRSGNPRCYLAIKTPDRAQFQELAFGRGECYAPGIAPLPDGRFGVIWEDGSGVGAALVQGDALGQTTYLMDKGGQGAMAWHPALGLVAAWSAPEGRMRRVWVARLTSDGADPRIASKRPLEAELPKDDQMYPALAATPSGISMAWEDRRLGHTVIFASQTTDGMNWSPVTRVSQNPTGMAEGTVLGRGTGAMRPALAHWDGGAAVVWLDKRDFLSGYDVYAALPGDTRNTKAQDSFGDAIAQWHPAVASQDGKHLVVAWDDDRDGTSDIWLSHLLPTGGFSENVAPAPASGPKVQTDPVLTLTAAGELHLAWVERDGQGHSSIRYSLGKPEPGH